MAQQKIRMVHLEIIRTRDYDFLLKKRNELYPVLCNVSKDDMVDFAEKNYGKIKADDMPFAEHVPDFIDPYFQRFPDSLDQIAKEKYLNKWVGKLFGLYFKDVLKDRVDELAEEEGWGLEENYSADLAFRKSVSERDIIRTIRLT